MLPALAQGQGRVLPCWGKTGWLCFPFSRCYLQLVFEADFGVAVRAPAAEQPVSVGVGGAWGPVVAFLPLGDWGCSEQERNRSREDFPEEPTAWP